MHMNIRISAQQKNAMLAIHYIELNHGLYTSVHTSYLRKHVGMSLCKELSSNHFLVSMNTLANNGYVIFQANSNRRLSSTAKNNESMWQLTDKGRIYAETLHSSRMRPRRSYTKRSQTNKQQLK